MKLPVLLRIRILACAAAGAWAAPASADSCALGDEVLLKQQETLFFQGEAFRLGQAGEQFRVLQYHAPSQRVFLGALDAGGRQIAVSVPVQSVEFVPGHGARLLAAALKDALNERFTEARKTLERATRVRPTPGGVQETEAAIHGFEAAIQSLARAQVALRNAAAEAQRLRRNAAVTDRPNPFNSADTSNQRRAAAIRMQAAEIEPAARRSLELAEAAVRSAREALEKMAATVPSAAPTPNPLENAMAAARVSAGRPGGEAAREGEPLTLVRQLDLEETELRQRENRILAALVAVAQADKPQDKIAAFADDLSGMVRVLARLIADKKTLIAANGRLSEDARSTARRTLDEASARLQSLTQCADDLFNRLTRLDAAVEQRQADYAAMVRIDEAQALGQLRKALAAEWTAFAKGSSGRGRGIVR